MSDHPVYASRADLALIVGNPTGQDERLDLALVLGSRWVDHALGGNAADDAAEVDSTPIAPPVTLTVLPVEAGPRGATLVAAARFLRSPDVPFGVAGGLGDLAVHIRAAIPEAEVALFGYHRAWGVA